MGFDTGQRTIQVGVGKGRAGKGGIQKVNVTSGASLLAAETILQSAIVEAGSLYKNGQGVRVFAAGKVAANGNDKLVKMYAGASEIFSTGTVAGNDVQWFIEAYIFRTAVDVQLAFARGVLEGGTYSVIRTALTLDDGADITITIKGTAATADSDITGEILTVETLAAP